MRYNTGKLPPCIASHHFLKCMNASALNAILLVKDPRSFRLRVSLPSFGVNFDFYTAYRAALSTPFLQKKPRSVTGDKDITDSAI
eukprot:1144236-Pelagomonas_calceolata.AAC.2